MVMMIMGITVKGGLSRGDQWEEEGKRKGY
jgi:hypothetical protein